MTARSDDAVGRGGRGIKLVGPRLRQTMALDICCDATTLHAFTAKLR
jgi:hypothetical protein